MFNWSFFKSQFKLNLNRAIVFMVLFFIINVIAIFISGTLNYDNNISSVVDYGYNVKGESQNVSSYRGEINGASKILNWTSTGAFAFFILAIFMFTSTTQLFVKEVRRGYIGSWLSLPLSRKMILLNKVLVIIVQELIIILPSFLLLTFYLIALNNNFDTKIHGKVIVENWSINKPYQYTFSKDDFKYFEFLTSGNIFINMFNSTVMLFLAGIFILTIFLTINIIFVDKAGIRKGLIVLIIVWIIFVPIANAIISMADIKALSWLKHFEINDLIAKPFDYTYDGDNNPKVDTWIKSAHKNSHIAKNIADYLISIIGLSGFGLLSVNRFDKLSLSI
ncbi:ABC transporter permease subunit [Spiroplasma endosymbiont of Crioceris asparagi]|uniref:ABC transporter permease subunit n=1 Tax=Spiroplasma endosymbiont of Crioceris asparagi TaxID=3066286 RepID=UPI0030CE6B50